MLYDFPSDDNSKYILTNNHIQISNEINEQIINLLFYNSEVTISLKDIDINDSYSTSII